MPAQDTSQIKEKIMSLLKMKGPSLPVHISKETGLSILFASAFLSELFNEKKIKISNIRVGNSPLYFIQGQEPQLERFSEHLKSKEKEAFLLIKNKIFLKDIKQEPAIRVALREIKDFAIPFKKDEEIYWRYFIVPESEFNIKSESIEKVIPSEEEPKKSEGLGIFDNGEKGKLVKKKGTKKKKASQKTNERFFNIVKEFLEKKSIKILDIVGFSKDDLLLKIEMNGEILLLTAYNKKRISEIEIIKSYKKAKEMNLDYVILSKGELPKKLSNIMEAIKTLRRTEIIE